MAQAHKHSPYTVREDIEQHIQYAPAEMEAYAVPNFNEDAPVEDSPISAWSPRLKEDIGSTPDPMRLGDMRQYDGRPPDGGDPVKWYTRIGRNLLGRHTVESQAAVGWDELVTGSGQPAADPPDRRPQDVNRPTAHMSPANYSFLRPMWGGPKELTGDHFSMADHRRNYPILGTQPVRTWRNTYRVDPDPWDTDLVDQPAPQQSEIPRGIQSLDVPLYSDVSDRSYRLV